MVRIAQTFTISAELKDLFEQIADAALASFQKTIKSKDSGGAKSKDEKWKIRFRHDAVTVLGSDIEELGVLDVKTAKILTELIQILPSLTFQPVRDQRGVASREANRHPLGIILYSDLSLTDQVDSILFQAGVYLQEPPNFDTSYAYYNPHILS
jgi:hypothetical protein